MRRSCALSRYNCYWDISYYIGLIAFFNFAAVLSQILKPAAEKKKFPYGGMLNRPVTPPRGAAAKGKGKM